MRQILHYIDKSYFLKKTFIKVTSIILVFSFCLMSWVDAKPHKKKKIFRIKSQHKASTIKWTPKRPKGFEYLNRGLQSTLPHTKKKVTIRDADLWSQAAFAFTRVGGQVDEKAPKGAHRLGLMMQRLIEIYKSLNQGDSSRALQNLKASDLQHIPRLTPLYLELKWRASLVGQDAKQQHDAAYSLLQRNELPKSLRDRVELSLAQSLLKMNLLPDRSREMTTTRILTPPNKDQPGQTITYTKKASPAPHSDGLAQAFDIAKKLSNGSKSLQVRAQAYGVLSKSSDRKVAHTAKKILWLEYGHTPIAQTLVEHWPNPTKADWFVRGKTLFKQRSYALALRSLKHILSTHRLDEIPSKEAQKISLWRQEAALLTAISWLRLRKNDEVSDKMLDLAVLGPDEASIQRAWFYRGILWGRMENWDQAIQAMQKYALLKKTGSRAQDAQYQVGRLLHQAGRYDEAIVAHKEFLKTRPKDPNKYVWFLGWSYYRQGNCKSAQKVWQPLLKNRNLLVGAKAKYWTARCLFTRKNKRAALRMLSRVFKTAPLSYYALLSQHLKAVILNREFNWKNPIRKARKRHFRSAAPANIKKWLKKLSKKRGRLYTQRMVLYEKIQSALALAPLGGERFAQIHYRSVCKEADANKILRKSLGHTNSNKLCDALAHYVGEYGVLWKKQAKARIPWLEGLHRKKPQVRVGAYPLAYYDLAQAAAQVEGVSPWWLMAHMLQESRYRPNVVSYAQAIGLMQILARTGIRIAQQIQWPQSDFYGDYLFDPALSLRYAAWYLKALWADLGHPILAIGAYNGGPMRFADHVENHPTLDFDELVEEMGAHESRNYMRKVTEHFIRYLAMYGSTEEWRSWTRALAPPMKRVAPKRSVGF
jgi:tetratricopeptide (TPR) repeat protein